MSAPATGRRDFLATASRFLGGGWMAVQLPVLATLAACAREAAVRGEPLTTLTAAEGSTLSAVVDLIIPPDDLPGAVDAGAVHFIDRILDGPFGEMLTPIREGLADLDRRARDADPAAERFSALAPERRMELVRQIEGSEFFGMTRALTVFGVFADPAYGGNRDGAGSRILGVEMHGAYQPPFGWYDDEYAKTGDVA